MFSHVVRVRRDGQRRSALLPARRLSACIRGLEQLETRELLAVTASPTTIVAVAGQPFTGTVALFSDSSPQPAPAGYSASIDWGDSQISVGTVMANAQGSFEVVGTHTYGAPSSSEKMTVTITRVADGQTVPAMSIAIVANAPNALSGQLDPLSDTGVSSADGITAINQPAFVGTAMPYAIVQLFARRIDQAQPVLLGQAITSAGGAWNLAVGALPDGVYAFTATEIPPTGLPSPMVSLTPGRVTIDTVPPTVVGATSHEGSGQVAVTFQDVLTGLDSNSLTNPAHYALVGQNGARIHPSSVTILPIATVRLSDPVTVALQFSGVTRIHRGQLIALGGISDLVGNRLPREYLRISVVGHWSTGTPAVSGSAARAHHGQRRV